MGHTYKNPGVSEQMFGSKVRKITSKLILETEFCDFRSKQLDLNRKKRLWTIDYRFIVWTMRYLQQQVA